MRVSAIFGRARHRRTLLGHTLLANSGGSYGAEIMGSTRGLYSSCIHILASIATAGADGSASCFRQTPQRQDSPRIAGAGLRHKESGPVAQFDVIPREEKVVHAGCQRPVICAEWTF